MNRYRQYGQLDDVPEVVGDGGFIRLDMLTDPALLDPGSLSVSENMRFDARGTTVRGGIARQFPAGVDIGTIRFAAIWKPDAADDQFAFVTSDRLTLFRTDNQTLTAYSFPDGETVDAADSVDLVQAGVGSGTLPTLYILRGVGKSVLKFDAGGGTVTVASDFARGDFALFYQDRIAVANWQDVEVSDFLDFTVFNLLNQFQILKGGDDYLTCFLRYQNDYVLIGSRRSWSIAFFDPTIGTGGYSGGLQDSSFLRQLTTEAGPLGPRAAIAALGKIWFLTDNAIYAFQPQLDQTLTVLGRPISADIQPIMDRMSVRYAGNACVERWGYRLYFAFPVSDDPIAVTDITVQSVITSGVDLPFDLPVNLTTGSLATVETEDPHDFVIGDRALIGGSSTSSLNGEFPVVAVLDENHFIVALDAGDTVILGDHVTVQKVATRNNVIAVYNLNNDGWESIDRLPNGFHADWLRAADFGTRRRLWVVDANSGPALYEELDADETGNVLGGISVPFDVPIDLSAANFASQAIPGHITTRALRWTSTMTNMGAGAFSRKVNGCEARATMPANSALTLTLLARTPNHRLWSGSRSFVRSQFRTDDVPLRKLCGERALEAQVDILVTSGRPTIRSVIVETINAGKTEE